MASIDYDPMTISDIGSISTTTGTLTTNGSGTFTVAGNTIGAHQLNIEAGVKCSKISQRGEAFSDYGHRVSPSIEIEKDKIVVRFSCEDCEEVLAEKVLFKLPKSIKKKKCLPRMIKGDKTC